MCSSPERRDGIGFTWFTDRESQKMIVSLKKKLSFCYNKKEEVILPEILRDSPSLSHHEHLKLNKKQTSFGNESLFHCKMGRVTKDLEPSLTAQISSSGLHHQERQQNLWFSHCPGARLPTHCLLASSLSHPCSTQCVLLFPQFPGLSWDRWLLSELRKRGDVF